MIPTAQIRFAVMALTCAAAWALPFHGAGADEFSSPITWMTPAGQYVAPIHIMHLPDGRLLMVGRSRDSFAPEDKTNGSEAAFVMTPSFDTPDILYVDNIESEVPLEYRLQGLTLPWAGGAAFAGNDSMYCAGHTFTADGKALVLGGTRSYYGAAGAVHHVGLPYSLTYDGAAWGRVDGYFKGTGYLASNLTAPFPNEVLTWRWYSTGTRLADDRILVTGGFDYVLGDLSPALRNLIGMPGTPNVSVEILDPANGNYELLVDGNSAPMLLWNRDYTHTFMLPHNVNALYDILMFGEFGAPVMFSTRSPARFEQSGSAGTRPLRPNTNLADRPNHGTTSVMLPLRATDGEWGYNNGTVLMAGGGHHSAQEHLVDLYDPVANNWLPTIDIGDRRHHGSTVLLPDGKVLLIEGHDVTASPPASIKVQYIDPADGMALSSGVANHSEIRGYHTVSALLMDGRVIVGGGNPGGVGDFERVDFRYYSPDYMSGPRPQTLVLSPGPFAYGQYYAVVWNSATPVTEIVLISPASMTHSFDANQRYVQLKTILTQAVPDSTLGVTIFQAPPNSQYAPRGDYMLFAVDSNRIPAPAKMIRLE